MAIFVYGLQHILSAERGSGADYCGCESRMPNEIGVADLPVQSPRREMQVCHVVMRRREIRVEAAGAVVFTR
jgi:hypothetical protein